MERVGYCGVDCAVCPDFLNGTCPDCRSSVWPEGDPCPPIACCREKGIEACGACGDFPCQRMAEFYEESDSHRAAFERMRAVSRRTARKA